jgi:hypothetical protein
MTFIAAQEDRGQRTEIRGQKPESVSIADTSAVLGLLSVLSVAVL